ncbi:hypothetical protein D3C75_951150 [compost metagenome]
MYRLQYRLVVANIRFVKGIAILVIGDHVVERLLDLCQIARGCALCRPASYCWLDQISHLAHGADQPWVIVVFQHPLQHIGIEVVPLVTWGDKGATITLHFYQPLRHQRAENFPNDVARRFELFAQLCLSRERRAGNIFTANNLGPQGDDDTIGFIESHGESLCSVCPSLLYRDR